MWWWVNFRWPRGNGHPWLFWACVGVGVLLLLDGMVLLGMLLLFAAWRLLVR